MSATRRTILAGIAGIAVPVLGSGHAASLAAPSGLANTDPDADLLALIAAVPALAERSLVLGREHDRIEEACLAQTGPAPQRPACNPAAFPDFRDFDRAMDAWQAELVARDARLVAAGEALGFKQAAEAYLAADQALVDACDEIAAVRALTLPGLIAKARLAQSERFPELAESLVADLVAMGDVA